MTTGILKRVIGSNAMECANRIVTTDVDGRIYIGTGNHKASILNDLENLISIDIPNVLDGHQEKIKTIDNTIDIHLAYHNTLINGNFKLTMQSDGNLVIYDSSSGSDVPTWDSNGTVQ